MIMGLLRNDFAQKNRDRLFKNNNNKKKKKT